MCYICVCACNALLLSRPKKKKHNHHHHKKQVVLVIFEISKWSLESAQIFFLLYLFFFVDSIYQGIGFCLGDEHEKVSYITRPSIYSLQHLSLTLFPCIYKHPQPSHIFPQHSLSLSLSSSFLYNTLESSLHLLKNNMSRPGDWNCRSCQHLNFQRRDSCQRCGDPRSGSFDRGSHHDFGNIFGGAGSRGGGGSSFGLFNSSNNGGAAAGSDVRPGDWYCTAGNCGTHNFASRSSCFKCGAFKDESSAAAGGGIFDSDLMPRSRGFGYGGGAGGGSGGGGRSGWKSGDWICGRLGCNEHNFASRMECFRCNAPRGI